MKFLFPRVEPWSLATNEQWTDWRWQLRNSLRDVQDYSKHLELSESEKLAFEKGKSLFQVRTTPYYMGLLKGPSDPLRSVLVPTHKELEVGLQAELDPLGEKKNSPTPRLIHRYSDRVLLLATD